MDSNRRASVSAGILFIAATVAILFGSQLSQPILNDPDYITKIDANANRVAGGVLLELIAAGASAGIAVSMYPVLKKWSGGLALGAVVFRSIEAVMYTAGAVSLLSLLTLGQKFTRGSAAERVSFQVVGDSLEGVRAHAILAGVFAFSLGTLMYYYLLFRSRLIPRWLSGWGIVSIMLTIVACLLSLFSDSPVTGYKVLVLPIAVQEMVVATWLLVKGFAVGSVGTSSLTETG